jgi:UDPglucose 6-dehydrogenase
MITFFTVPKAFSGHIGLIQRNALQSWMRLHRDAEIILLGDDDGTAGVAAEFGVAHVPEIARNEFGTPLVNDVFARGSAHARHDLLCYINADIVLLSDFWRAATQLRDLERPFLMCGRRWKVDLREPLVFDDRWEDGLRRLIAHHGTLDVPACADYFLFTPGVFGDIPPFAIGRKRWDRWLQARARDRVRFFVDATAAVTAVHQNHAHGDAGFVRRKRGPETQRNIELSGDRICDVRQATHKITRRGRITRAVDLERLRWRARLLVNDAMQGLKHVEARASALLVRARLRRVVRASRALRRFVKTGVLGKPQRVAVIGLGKIGLPLAVCLAQRHIVEANDRDAAKRTAIRTGRVPQYEPGLDELLRACRGRLRVQDDLEKSVYLTATTMLVLPTQSADGADVTPQHLRSVCQLAGRAIAAHDDYHLVVIVSTVMPGWIDGIIRDALEHASGKRVGDLLGLCYWPAFVALGSAVEGLTKPEFVLIGESDPNAGDRLERLVRPLLANNAPVVRTSIVNAELAKIALNTYVSMKISFANVLSQMCEQLPGSSVDAVTSILQMDSRIGRGYLTGGPSYGGPCFPRDVPAFAEVARQLGAPDDLAVATDRVNDRMMHHVLELVRESTRPGQTVGICGVAFKPGTSCTDGSLAMWLARQLTSAGYPVLLYDPDPSRRAARSAAGWAATSALRDCVRRAATIVFTSTDREFSAMHLEVLNHDGVRRTVIDCWRIFPADKIARVADYRALGRPRRMQPRAQQVLQA